MRAARDKALLDAIEAVEPVDFAGHVWRIVRDGRDPLLSSASGGRWDDGTFEVLYTALTPDGAGSEMRFHLMRGQPVMPSRVTFRLFELNLHLTRALKLLDLTALAGLGLDTVKFGRLSYETRSDEYPRTQHIGEVAHFLDFDGLVVPSARFDGLNAILFADRVPPASVSVKTDLGLVNWT